MDLEVDLSCGSRRLHIPSLHDEITAATFRKKQVLHGGPCWLLSRGVDATVLYVVRCWDRSRGCTENAVATLRSAVISGNSLTDGMHVCLLKRGTERAAV